MDVRMFPFSFFRSFFLNVRPSPPHQHCHLYTVYTPLLGTVFFSFHPSVVNLMNVYLYFLYLFSFPSLSSVVLYLSDCGHVTDVSLLPLETCTKTNERTNEPTPFNTCLRSRNFSTCSRAPGVGHESTGLWKGGDRQLNFDSYCACINMQFLCFIGREREREREVLQWYSLVPEFYFSVQIIWPRFYIYFVFIFV